MLRSSAPALRSSFSGRLRWAPIGRPSRRHPTPRPPDRRADHGASAPGRAGPSTLDRTRCCRPLPRSIRCSRRGARRRSRGSPPTAPPTRRCSRRWPRPAHRCGSRRRRPDRGERHQGLPTRSPGTSTSTPTTATTGCSTTSISSRAGPRADGDLAHPHAAVRGDDPGAAAGEGLPGDLVYLALIESGFSNTATSRAKAVGMWQFMKGTARATACGWTPGWTSGAIRTAPPTRRPVISAISTTGSARSTWPPRRTTPARARCRAALRAAAGRRRGRLANSDATFFRLYDTKLLRRETKDYVPKLIAAARHREGAGALRLRASRPSEPPAYDSIIVPTMTGLDVIARLADTTVAAIRELNPQYLRLATPPGVASVVRVPAGAGPARSRRTPSCRPSQRVTFVEHIVARGETMGGIARPLSREHAAPGRRQSRGSAAARSGRAARHRADRRGALHLGGAPRGRPGASRAASSPTGFHRVRRGETLSGLADEYGVTVRSCARGTRSARSGSDPRGPAAPGRGARPSAEPRRRAQASLAASRSGCTRCGGVKR